MKKTKRINILLSSLTLLSPLAGIGFNNQYQNTQKIITENSNELNNYFSTNAAPVKMGDIWVTVHEYNPTIITGYSSGNGTLTVTSDITEIYISAFDSNENIISLDLSNATSLTTIGPRAFDSCSNLTGNLVIPSSISAIDQSTFENTKITSLDLSNATNLISISQLAFHRCSNLTGNIKIPLNLRNIGSQVFAETKINNIEIDPSNQNFSLATNLGPNAQVLISGTEGIWKDESKTLGSLAIGDVVIPSSVTTIENYAFNGCSNLTGDLVVPSNLETIGTNAFWNTNITSLDLSNATSLTTIGARAFKDCTNISGDLIIPSKVSVIGTDAFRNTTFDNLFFTSKTVPGFNLSWQPTVTGKVYVPSQEAKEAYLAAPSFGFDSSQVELLVSGETTINSQMGVAGSKQYTLNTEFNPDQWEIVMSEGVKPEWLSINNSGLLSWTENSSAGAYKFKIKATNTQTQTFGETQEITLSIYNPQIAGKNEIKAINSFAGSEQYSFNSTPEGLSADQWEIVMTQGEKPEWLSIDNQGLLSWTNQCVAGTYNFKIKATNTQTQIFGETQEINLIIESNPQVLGKTEIYSETTKKGSEQFKSSSELFNPTKWEIIMTEGETPNWLSISEQGLLSWTELCVEGTYKFKIKATDDTFPLSIETQEIILTITNNTPKTFNIPWLLALLILLGIPVVLAIAFIIWNLTKKRETEVKIKKKK